MKVSLQNYCTKKLDHALLWPRVFLASIFDKQPVLAVEEEADQMLHLEHCSLYVRNMNIKKNRFHKSFMKSFSHIS